MQFLQEVQKDLREFSQMIYFLFIPKNVAALNESTYSTVELTQLRTTT